MTEATERVRAPVDGMREAASSYRDGRLPLDRLVWELKSRIAALRGVADQEWVEELRSAWWQLESVNAFWIESGRAELTQDERRDVDEGLDELLPMLVEY
jgi:hypothetical protein